MESSAKRRYNKRREFLWQSRIVLNTISYHGHGAIENIVPELTARGYKKAFVCSDPDLIRLVSPRRLLTCWTPPALPIAVYSEIKPNLPSRTFRTALPPLKSCRG